MDFEDGIIDEALIVAQRLREQSAVRVTQDAVDKSRQALDQRNRFASLLIERMRTARQTAHQVFRNHPEIAREASSSYEHGRPARRRAPQPEEVTEAQAG